MARRKKRWSEPTLPPKPVAGPAQKSPDPVPKRPQRSVPLRVRVGVAVAGLIVMGFGTRWAASQAVPTAVRLPTTQQLATFPYQLGPWKGEDTPVDKRILAAVGTELTINRTYRQSAENYVGFHAAVFTQPEFSLPHPPELCYGGTGWRVRGTKDTRIILSDGTSGSVRVLTLERRTGGETATVLYCYQLAGPFSADRDTVRTFFWKYRGQKSRPPLVKLMFHLPGSGETTEELGRDFAQRALEKLAEMENTW